ncbi:hypothetical protein NK553_14685 [Pseudomonas sp. ZM23]|uniref:Mu-like prophage FluMu N-terminal domain-containing protein n=1 Tax=Pseudomonas triclosanedens TaxID=2961893 RepID=A0ABY6ZW82_9PSED|nr:hypothetical protein [Pseudomonas triclosanedens]MCP8465196.1 hypothetical protein [Pseudomonas triclosanedens]MCP8470864.1 hypothetical protein [Pseudomonas triclosanedens]MCP8476567.1 hypothetical protein [Pseudomonas triclosanedens]WAI49048.1 hypothetical protein OU419_25415 [Pseudomonas triclosanedens]
MAAKKTPGNPKARAAGKSSQQAKAVPASTGTQDDQVSKDAKGTAAGQNDQGGQGSEARPSFQIVMAGQGDDTARAVVDALTSSGGQVTQPDLESQDDKDLPSAIEGIYVRSFPPTFRRAGFAFTSEGMGIALSAITAEQLKAIQDEPMLSVEFCDFPVDDTSVGAAEAGEQTGTE